MVTKVQLERDGTVEALTAIRVRLCLENEECAYLYNQVTHSRMDVAKRNQELGVLNPT